MLVCTGSSSLQCLEPFSKAQDLIKRFKATVVTIPLGAYGAFTAKPAPGLY